MLKKIQKEHLEWQLKNFGTLPPVDSIMGMIEEIGELCHAYNHEKWGVRGSLFNMRAKAKDAVGDIAIFLMSYCSSMGFDLQDIIVDTWIEVSKRDWVKHPEKGVPNDSN